MSWPQAAFFVAIGAMELYAIGYMVWSGLDLRRKGRALDREWDRFTGQQR